MKNGYIYTIDVTIAIFVVVIGLLAVLGAGFFVPDTTRANALSADVISLLSDTRVSDLCVYGSLVDDCTCTSEKLAQACSQHISDRNATLIDAIGELHYKGYSARVGGSDDLVTPILDDLLRESGAVPEQLGLEVVLYDETGASFSIYGESP